VICTLGLPKATKGDRTISTATACILEAMQRCHVRRIVVQTAFGLGDSVKQANWLFRSVVLRFLRTAYEDKRVQEDVVRGSDRDWTLLRPTRLVDGPATGGACILGARQNRLLDSVSRADVARVLLQIVADATLIRRAVSLGAA
jgi:hypothetical protein